MSIGVEVEVELDRQLRDLGASVPRDFFPQLLEDVGAEVASQTQRRIAEEQTDPDGAPWKPWSKRYARTRHAGQQILFARGDLAQSIQHEVDGDEVAVGTPLVYGRTHQLGDEGTDRRGRKRNIPARAYLGLSTANLRELDAVIQDAWKARR